MIRLIANLASRFGVIVTDKVAAEMVPIFGAFGGASINLLFIRLRQNTLRLAAGMNGEVNRAEAHQSEGGLAMAQFRLIPHRLRWGASSATSRLPPVAISPFAALREDTEENL